MLQGLESVLRGYAGFTPGLAISAVLGAVLSMRVAATFKVTRVHGFWLVFSLGLILSATITPAFGAFEGGLVGAGTCDFTRIGLPSVNQLRWPSEVLLNILLFGPFGLALGGCPPSRVRRTAVALAYALPLGVEFVQLMVVQLARQCQSGDVIDNMTGLTVGLVVGSGGHWLWRRRQGVRPQEPRRRQSIPWLVGGGVAMLGALGLISVLVQPSWQAPPQPDRSFSTAPPASPEPAPSGASVRVNSIGALLDALADNAIGEIVVVDGTYRVSPASHQEPDSLWIGERYASRTNPILVRAESNDGVTFDGGGNDDFGGLTFVEGAHHQTWEGFRFANGMPTETGAIVFGGYPGRAAPHHITLRNITIEASVTGRATSSSAPGLDHAIYVSQAVDGPHDLLLEQITVDGRGGLASALVFFHSDAENRNGWNVTVRRLFVRGTQQAIMLWDPTLRDITIDTAEIVDPLSAAVTYESPGATGIVLANITSTGSGSGKGFISSMGDRPPDVVMMNNSFR